MEKTKTDSKISEDKSTRNQPRLKPIEDPKSVKLKLAYWFTKKKMGKVISPLKVVQVRMPETLSLSQKLLSIEKKSHPSH